MIYLTMPPEMDDTGGSSKGVSSELALWHQRIHDPHTLAAWYCLISMITGVDICVMTRCMAPVNMACAWLSVPANFALDSNT